MVFSRYRNNVKIVPSQRTSLGQRGMIYSNVETSVSDCIQPLSLIAVIINASQDGKGRPAIV